ncbi:hypothetical protein [Lentibacillus persicus]|uniref:hypothetical protein n=1 Tax=Lentibacillus persicus TaxID=640948 RepID=UPI001C43527F|nr:hypothetical protein [Lentibacillus persicus]
MTKYVPERRNMGGNGRICSGTAQYGPERADMFRSGQICSGASRYVPAQRNMCRPRSHGGVYFSHPSGREFFLFFF